MVASLLAAAPAIAEPTPTPAPTGATASPDLVDAAKAEAKHTGKEVEIPSLHTENMTTVATPGGKTVKTYVSLAPVRAKRAGQWLDIDPTLIVADGVVKPKVTALDITLSNGGDGPLLTAKGDTLGDKDDPGEIVVAAPGKLPAPELSGSTATYRSAYGRNVDLVVTVTPDGYQHQIVIRDKPAKPLKLTVPIDPPSGMSLGKSSSGKPAALSDGKQVADLSTLPLIDAKEIVSPGSGKAGQVTTTVTGTGDKAALVLAPDAAFLADPAVTYPVTIAAGNPTPWHGAGAPADTFIANGGSYVNGSYMANDAAIFAGRRGGYNYRTYLKFNLTGAPFYGRQILDANIILWNYISHACGEVGGISMHRVAADWTPTGITWGNQPLAVADGHVINPYGKDANCSDWMAEGELWYSIEEIAQEWADMTPNRGLMIRSVNESSGTNWRQYLSGNYGGVDGHHPYFFLEYEAPSSPPEVIVYSYEGPKRTTLPTYEEALAMRVDTPGEIPYTPPMTESDLQALVARQNHVAEISPEELEPFTGESGEESWDGGTVEEGDPSDTTPPTVTSTVPAADERGVLTDTPIRATFSESVWEPEFLVTDPAGGKIEGSVTGDANGTTFTFAPAQPLKPGTRYTVRISEAIDAAANAVTAYQWSFETKADASGHWTFDEGSGGTAHDTSGKDHDAALNETASWNPGKSGNALTNTPSAATSQKSSPSRVISVAAAPTMSGFAVNPSQSVDGEIVTSSLTPELQVKVTDTGGRASKVDFQVVQGFSPYNTVWSGSVASAASGTVAKLAVGAGKLADGKEYYWQAKATAGTEASSWSSPQYVTVDVPEAVVDQFQVSPSRIVDGETISLSLTPSLLARVSDPLGGASKVDVQVVQGFSPFGTVWSGSVASVASGAQAAFQVPSGKLLDGKEYYWQVKATTPGSTPSWSSPQYVTVDVPEAVVDQFQVTPSRIVDGETISSSLTPTLLARVSDPLGGASKVDVQVVQGFSPFGTVWSGSVASVASGAQAAFQVPSGKLLDGKEYYWQVKATTPGSTPSWSSPQYVTVDVPEAVVDQFQVTPSRIVDGGTVTSSLTPTLHARVTDPLGGASTVDVQVVQNFSPYTTVWTGSAANVASGSAAALKVAAGLLADGKEYYWQVRATTPGSTPSWSNSQTFTVDVPEAVVDQFQVTPAETLSGATRITSVTPTLHARVTDPLGGASTVDVQVVQNFSPYTTVWTGSVANVASGTQASIQVPAGKLADRKEYYWQVKATTPGSSPSWSNSQTFTVDVFDPATDPAVSQLQVVPSQQIDGVTTSSSVTPQLRAAVSHPQGSASRVEFEVEHDPAAPQGQGRGRIWTTALVGVASGSQAAVNVPQSTLADGWLVRWRTRSIVGTTTSTWSTWQQLQVAVPKPGVGQFQVTPSSVVDGKTVTTVLTPALHAQVTYAPGGELKAEFEVEHDPSAPEGQGSGPIWTGTVENVPAGTQTSVAVPAGELADGWAVRWRVRSSAGTLISPWSDWQSLLVDRPDSAPAVQDPQVTPSAQVDGRTVASTVTPQLRATLLDPRGDDLTAEFEVEHDPAAPDGQGSGPIWAGDVAGVAVGSQAVLAVPGGVLSDGWVVRWRARAASASVTSPWSDWQLLTVDVPKPGLGEVRVTPSSVVEGKTVTPVLTPSLYAQVTYAPGGAMRAEFEMEHDPGAPAGQGSGQIWAASVEGDANTQVVASVPVGELSDGWTVRWRVRSLAADLTSPWSAWQQLVVDRPESAPGVEDLQVTPCKTVNGQTVTNTVTPQLRATPTDPRGDALTAEFEIEHDPSAPDGQGNGPIWAGAVADAQPGSPASLAVPLGKLTDGWLVRWRARAVSPSTASPWSGWQVLKVDVIHPGEEPLAQTDGPVIRTDESFTVAAWLKWSDKDGAYSVIEQKGAHQAPFKLGNDPEDGLVFTFTSADTADATVDGVRSGVEPPVNEWFHLAGVYDSAGNTATLYLNGVNVGAASLSSTRWHADAALSLGARAVGGLDDVWVYQRPLTSDDIASLLMAGETPTPAPATGKASETAGTLSEPDPYEVNYRHFTLDTCRSKAPKEAIWGIWTDATVFSGCSVRWFGISMWMDDLDYPSGSGKKKRIKLPDGSEGLDMIVRSTVVMNSYLGTRDGTSIRKLGSDGVTGPLSPKEFSMWVAFDQLDFALETGIGNSRMKLAVTAASGTDGATCSKTVNGDREALVKDWDDTTRYFRFKSESTTSKVRTCSVSPWVEVKDLVTNVGPSSFPLWGKLKDEQPKGIWTPPTVRCDDLTLGPGAPGNWPEEKRVRYTGACIFPDVSRIYRTDVDHSKRGPVAAHIWAAFNDTDNTEPKKAPGQKIVPGNWDGKTPATRAALTRINESALRPGDPRGRTWGAVQVSERRKACRAAKVVGDCDEFPFNSVKEGPGWGDGNFSVRGVPSANNKSDGWYLSVFYARYRVLIPEGPDRPNGDRFWVSVKGTP